MPKYWMINDRSQGGVGPDVSTNRMTYWVSDKQFPKLIPNSPYLWSYSNLYTSGKFIRDNVWSDKAVSGQCGAAVILRRMSDDGDIDLASPPSSKLTDAATLAEVPRHLFDD